MFHLYLLLIVLVISHTAMGQDERDDSIQVSLQHLEQKMRVMEKILLKIDKNFQTAKNNETCISQLNNSTEERLHLLEQKIEEMKNIMLSQLAGVKEEIILEVSTDISQLNDSIQENYQQLANQKKKMLSRLAAIKEEIIAQLNDSIQESYQQLTNQMKQIKRDIISQVSPQLQLLTPSNSCRIDGEMIKQDIVSEITTMKKLLSPMLQHYSFSSIGSFECNPAQSCKDIKNHNPNSTSGYYYIKKNNGPIIRVYCKMTSCKGVGGPWMRVVDFNADNTSQSCPSGLQLFTNIRRRCGMPSDGAGCASTMFDVHGIPYQKVCGKVTGYQEGSTDAFASSNGINGAYVDGASLTHGSNPRHHIWTLIAALDEAGTNRHAICPCTHRGGSATQLPSFIGSSYFCDTGSRSRFSYGKFYGDNPLWDGAGCGGSSTCCSFNTPPWFMKQLSSSTSDDLELRVCRNEPRSNEDVGLKSVELYLQ